MNKHKNMNAVGFAKPYFILVFILFSFFFLPAIAQPNFKKESLSEKDGLPHRWVCHIIQDQLGFIWVATDNGLARYDGHEFKTLYFGLGDSPISRVAVAEESRDGAIWVQLNKGGTFLLDPISLTHRAAEEGKDFFMPIQKGKQLIDTRLWIFLEEMEQLKGTGKNDSDDFWNVVQYAHGCDLNSFMVKTEMGEMWLWHFSQFGLNKTREKDYHYQRFDLRTQQLENFKINEYLNVPSAHDFLPIDAQGRFWYPADEQKKDAVFDYFQLPKGTPLKEWVKVQLDNQFNIWFQNQDGQLFRFEIKTKQIQHFGKAITVTDREHFKIFEDKDGIIWIGSENGIKKITRSRQLFDNYLNAPFQLGETPPIGNSLYQIVEGENQQIFVNDFIRTFHISPATHTVRQLPFKDDKQIMAVGQKYYYAYTPTFIRKVNTSSFEDERIEFPTDTISELKDTKNKMLFHLYERNKHLVIDTSTNEIKWLVYFRDYKFNHFWDKEKNLFWMNGTDGRFAVADLTDFSVKEFSEDEVGGLSIRDWLKKEDILWMATTSGLKKLDLRSHRIVRTYDTTDGLPHDIIYSVIEAGDNLWLGTHFGLCCFNPNTLEVKNFYVEDGLSHNEFNTNSILKASDGKIWMGGLNGLNVFDPMELEKTVMPSAELFLTEFRKYNLTEDSIYIFNNLEQLKNRSFTIHPGDQSFVFQFITNNLTEPQNNRYFWYLEGHETEWQHVGNSHVAEYQNVPPGKYVLKIKANDHRGNPARNELAINIEISQVWYLRWWAWASYILLLSGGFWLFHKFRVSQKLKEQEAHLLKAEKKLLEEKNAQIATEKKNADEQRERAERSEKFKEQFLANMSHEIRTPMHAISGMVKILRRNERLPGQEIFLDAINQSADNLIVILNDILDLSKIEAGKLEIESIPMNPRHLFKNVVDILKYKAEEKGVELTTHISEKIPQYIMGDPTRLSQILINLAGNAIKFTENGKVHISLSENHDEKNGTLLFSVKDNGIGIPKNKLESIFGTFEQVDEATTRKYGGTGLGLSICRQLVELQNGHIWAESELGKGSIFYFKLPFVPAEKKAVDKAKISEATLKEMGASLGELKILLADDNAFNLMIAQDDLSYYIPKAKIDTAVNGRISVDKYKNENYDLILMDVQMPEMSGHEAAREIRDLEKLSNNGKNIAIIAMAASLLRSEINSCYESGMDGYIPKPYKAEELIGTICKEMNNLV